MCMMNRFILLIVALLVNVSLSAQQVTASVTMIRPPHISAVETAVSSSMTGLTETTAPSAAGEVGKYIEDGHVIIRKDGKRYSAEGILKK